MASTADFPGADLERVEFCDDELLRLHWDKLDEGQRKRKAQLMHARSVASRKAKELARKERDDLVDVVLNADGADVSAEDFREKMVRPAAVLAFGRLAHKAVEKDDTSLQKWLVEHYIGKPSSKQEIEGNVGVTINIVRPARGEVVDGEVVDDGEVEALPAA